jgi:hypothetical protein
MSAFENEENGSFWRIAALGLVAGNIRLQTKAEAGELLLAPIYEFTASFLVLQSLQPLLALFIRLKWRSIVFTAGGSRSGRLKAISSRIFSASVF